MKRLKRWLRRVAIGVAIVLVIGVLATHRMAWAMVRYAGSPGTLIVPVVGVKRAALHSSWDEPRSGHRKHAGIDIFAHRGTPVVAAAEGEVVRIGTTDRLGGNIVWVAGNRRRSTTTRTSITSATGCASAIA